jgi:hypothetical protein
LTALILRKRTRDKLIPTLGISRRVTSSRI